MRRSWAGVFALRVRVRPGRCHERVCQHDGCRGSVDARLTGLTQDKGVLFIQHRYRATAPAVAWPPSAPASNQAQRRDPAPVEDLRQTGTCKPTQQVQTHEQGQERAEVPA